MKFLTRHFLTGIILFFSLKINAQTNISGIINIYTPVLNLSSNSVQVQSAVGFSISDRVLIIQMQGAAIDSVDNNSSFGSILNYGNAGNYEFETISNITGNIITFQNSITRTYTVAGKIQLVRVPQYVNANVIGTLTCSPWNGSIGGVLAFEVCNSLTLNNDIDVTGMGFRGGKSIPNGVCPSCANVPGYFYALASDVTGQKGEGVFVNINPNLAGGKGAIANGGGAGACKNAGGGGGGNIGSGGLGGLSFNVCAGSSPIPSGIGAYALDSIQTLNRFFMGGGAGGGEEDNPVPVGTDGTNGGGIIIIKADTLNGGGHQIKSNGTMPTVVAQWDGGGGGGAAGSIILDIQNFAGSLFVHANGAKGSDNNSNNYPGYCHAPGGGGGGGLIWFSASSTPAGVTPTALKGDSGMILNNTSSCAGTSYGARGGTNGFVLFNHTVSISAPCSAKPLAGFNPTDTTFCIEGVSCVNFFDRSTGNPTSWQWKFPGAVPDTSSLQNPVNICYSNLGTYPVTLIVTNSAGTDTLTISPMVTFSGGPPVPTIVLKGDTLICTTPGIFSYLWYFNGSPIAGATQSYYISTTVGTYSVLGYDSLGCSRISNGILFLSVNEIMDGSNIEIYPNRAKNQLFISGSFLSCRDVKIELYDLIGNKVYNNHVNTINNKIQLSIDVSDLLSGLYILRIQGEREIINKKLLLQK